MHIETAIGVFTEPTFFDGAPVTVKVKTDAVLETSAAKDWLTGLLHDKDGVGEIADISLGVWCLIIEMTDQVLTEEEASQAVVNFLELVKEAAPQLSKEAIEFFDSKKAIKAAQANCQEQFELEDIYANRY